MQTVCVAGVRIRPITMKDLLGEIDGVIDRKGRAIFANVNVHAINIAYESPWFRRFLNDAQLVFCDGFGVLLAAYLLGRKLPERITYADFMPVLAERGSTNKYKFFFLGAKPGIAERAADKLRMKYPDLKVNCHHGFFDRRKDSSENRAIIELINQSQSDILVLGMGMPFQESWLLENFENLNVRLALPAGAVFDYMSGELPRPPKWMHKIGLEWLGRLLIEPRRLWRRYLIGIPLFLYRVLREGYFDYDRD